MRYDPVNSGIVQDPNTGRFSPSNLGPLSYGGSSVTSTYIGISDADLAAGWRPVAGYTEKLYGAPGGIGADSMRRGGPVEHRLPVYGQPIYTQANIDHFLGAANFNEVLEMQKDLYNYGYLDKIDTPGVAGANFQAALNRLYSDANQNGMTTKQLFARYDSGGAKLGLKMGPNGIAGGGGSGTEMGPQTTTTTSTSVQLTSRAGAWQVLIGALTNELGREPTDAEINRFAKSLNAKERADPTSSTSTSTYDPATGKTVTTQSSHQSGVEASAEAMAYSRSPQMAKERHQYKGAQYFDVIADMLGG